MARCGVVFFLLGASFSTLGMASDLELTDSPTHSPRGAIPMPTPLPAVAAVGETSRVVLAARPLPIPPPAALGLDVGALHQRGRAFSEGESRRSKPISIPSKILPSSAPVLGSMYVGSPPREGKRSFRAYFDVSQQIHTSRTSALRGGVGDAFAQGLDDDLENNQARTSGDDLVDDASDSDADLLFAPPVFDQGESQLLVGSPPRDDRRSSLLKRVKIEEELQDLQKEEREILEEDREHRALLEVYTQEDVETGMSPEEIYHRKLCELEKGLQRVTSLAKKTELEDQQDAIHEQLEMIESYRKAMHADQRRLKEIAARCGVLRAQMAKLQ